MKLLDPITLKRIRQFKRIRRGYFSAILFIALILFSCLGELFINSRALIVRFEGKFFFPVYGSVIPGTEFGLSYDYETNYRELKTKFHEENSGNWLLMPIVPYNAYENDLPTGVYPPTPPSWKDRHFLGTDTTGRDILARLAYGFRVAIFFSLTLLFFNYLLGVALGCAMGYWGGLFDLILQRVIEIWSNVPFLYTIMIVSSIMVPTLGVLVGIMIFFGWTSMTWYLRTLTYREKAREYVLAAEALGASDSRIILKHILPNTISLIITFIPFSISSGIIALTSLDYLGFGLPAPTPSWGELLHQGWTRIEASWILASVVVAMSAVLVMVTFIGEAINEAFNPKQHTTYE